MTFIQSAAWMDKMKKFFLTYYDGAWGSVVVGLVGRSRDRFPVVSLGIFSIATDRTMCPGVDSASKNEYQGFLLG
jgi:hypothetical protein